MNIKIWFLALSLVSTGLQARYYVAKNEHQLVEELNKHEFSVVCFLGSADENMDKDDLKKLKKDMHTMQDMMKSVAHTDPYQKMLRQEVVFIIVDMHKDAMESLIKTYNIRLQEKPQIVLYRHGKAMTDMAGNIVKLSGVVVKADLLDFINDYCGKDFDDILAQKAADEAKDREMELARYQAFAAYRYPYGGYAPYNVWGSPSGSIYTGYASFYPYGYSYNGFAYMIP
jgi:hypothetical protein